MVFCVIHLDPPSDPPEDEEVYVIVPGAAKTAMAVPLDALPQFLSLLEQAIGGDVPPACPKCQTAIPNLGVCPRPHDDPAQSG